MTNKMFNLKNAKRAALAGIATIAVWAGASFYKLATSPSEEISIENPSQTYAILANCSGTTAAGRFSEENNHYSMLNVLSAYKAFKQEGLTDDNISLLLYNPSNEDVFETKEYKSLLEKKTLAGILPSKEDKLEIDGKATKKNFLDTLRKLNLDSNDTLYVVLSNPSPKEKKEFEPIQYATRNYHIDLDKEEIISKEFAYAMNSQKLKNAKKIIIFNSGDSNGFLSHLDKNVITNSVFLLDEDKKDAGLKNFLALSSPENWTFDKESFIINFLSQYKQDKKQPIKELLNKTNGKAYSFDGVEIAPEKNSWFNSPLFNN